MRRGGFHDDPEKFRAQHRYGQRGCGSGGEAREAQGHRGRARCEDRIRNAKDTGLRNLPLHGFGQNPIWCELVAMACELTAWMQMLALHGPARAWEPKRLRLRLFSAAGRIIRSGRRRRLRIAATSVTRSGCGCCP